MIKSILRKSGDEIAILVKARRAVAAGKASDELIENAYRIVARYPYNRRDDGILAAAQDAGIVQRSHLEQAEGISGWERLQLRYADGRREPLRILVYVQQNPAWVRFDIDVEAAAARIAKALPMEDRRQGEVATLTLSRAAVRKILNAQVAASVGGRLSDDAVTLIHRISDGWDDYHRAVLAGIAETPSAAAEQVSALPRPFSLSERSTTASPTPCAPPTPRPSLASSMS